MSPKGAIEIEASDFQIMDQCCGAHHSWEWFNHCQGLWMPLWLWGKGNPWVFIKAFDPNQSDEDHWSKVCLGSRASSLCFGRCGGEGKSLFVLPFWMCEGGGRPERSKTLLWRRGKEAWFRPFRPPHILGVPTSLSYSEQFLLHLLSLSEFFQSVFYSYLVAVLKGVAISPCRYSLPVLRKFVYKLSSDLVTWMLCFE